MAGASGGSRLTSAGVQSKTPCSQPHRSVIATNRLTPPSCHQKFGTATNPRQVQSLGAICDQTSAVTITSKSSDSQAPWASTATACFQFTPHHHHASHGLKSSEDQCYV